MRRLSERSSHGRRVKVENSQVLVHKLVSMLEPTSDVTVLTIVDKYQYKKGYIAIYEVQTFWPLKRPRPDEAHL